MSDPERLYFINTTFAKQEELRVVLVEFLTQDAGAAVPTATPRPADVACAVVGASPEWQREFLKEVRDLDGSLMEDLGVFGVDPGDSAKLLAVYDLIEAFGWEHDEERERGNYAERLSGLLVELRLARERIAQELP